MGSVGNVEAVARDRTTGNVVFLSSAGAPTDERIHLLGMIQIESPNDNPGLLTGAVEIVSGGEAVRPGLLGLQKRKALDGRYDMYEGVVRPDPGSGEVEVFVMSDPIEWALIGAGLAVCLVLRAPDIWLAKKVLGGYEKQGCVANFSVKTNWRSAITCSFSLELQAVNPRTGKVVQTKTVAVGRKHPNKK